MGLDDMKIRNAQAKEKAFRLKDDYGLYLEIHPTGKKTWRYRYWIRQKEGNLKLGEYPLMSLKAARLKCDECRRLVAVGIKPEARKNEDEKGEHTVTFEDITNEWLVLHREKQKNAKAARTNESRLKRYIMPYLGQMKPDDIQPPLLLNIIRRIESRGINETAHRVLTLCGQIFRYAVVTGNATRDPSADLKGALRPVKSKHFATITKPKEIGALMRACNEYMGSDVVRIALLMSALTFVRPGELRHMEWSEIDFDAAEWRIEAQKMKMGEEHIVPLSRQALELLHELWKFTGHGRYAFPSYRTPAGDRPMSENAVIAALRRMGYTKEEMTPHGFRAMAKTRLMESGLFNVDAIERQLAHAKRNKVDAAYNYAEYLPERWKMMQWWADYLDELRGS